VAAAVPLAGGDLVEVAPPLGGPDDTARTLDVAVGYFRETLAACAASTAG
jgi:hypothetical protein